MVFGGRLFPPRVLVAADSAIQLRVHPSMHVDKYVGRLFMYLFIFLVFTMSGNDPGVE